MLNEILDQYMRTLRKKNHVCCVVLQKNHNKNIIISEPHTHTYKWQMDSIWRKKEWNWYTLCTLEETHIFGPFLK